MKEKADLRSHLLAIQITEKVLLILKRHFVFLEYESNQGSMVAREIGFEENWVYTPTPMIR
jgi:hypothetical protein